MTFFDIGIIASIFSGIQAVIIFILKAWLKQSITHEYSKKLEEIKSNLQLDYEIKKQLYEGKLENYKKYFSYMTYRGA